jgi:hypothetical protein
MIDKEDSEKIKGKVAYWIGMKGLTSQKKELPRKEVKEMQKRVDKLNIIKGFQKAILYYCTFSPEEYKKKRKAEN